MIPIFSIIIIGFLLYNIFHGNLKQQFMNVFALEVILIVAYPQGSLISLGEKGISTQETLVHFVLFIYSVLLLPRIQTRIPFKMAVMSFVFIICIYMGLIWELVDPVTFPVVNDYADWDPITMGIAMKEPVMVDYKEQALFLIVIITYILDLFLLKCLYANKDMVAMLQKVVKTSQIFVYFGVLEFIVKNIINAPEAVYQFKTLFFGVREHTQISATKRIFDWYSLEGVTTEPSHFVMSLFLISVFSMIFMIIKRRYDGKISGFKGGRGYFFLIVLLMIGSGGFSALWYVTMLLVAAMIFKLQLYKAKLQSLAKYGFATILVVAFAFLIFYLLYQYGPDSFQYRMDIALDFLDNMFSGSSNLIYMMAVDSTVTRFISIHDVFLDFLQRPVFGIGIGIEEAFDEVVSMLSYVGILGLLCWIKFIHTKKYKALTYDKSLFIFIFFIVGIPSGVTHLGLPMISVAYLFLYELSRIYTVDKGEVAI